jgi:superfamily I DNA/RNA helicase
MQLTDQQSRFINHHEGPLLVSALAGTGKTFCITNRFVNLIKNHNVDPSRILCITFTNKAANEMKERICEAIGSNVNLHVFTFHGFCNYWLRKSGNIINLPTYSIMEPKMVDNIVSSIAGTTVFDKGSVTALVKSTNLSEEEAISRVIDAESCDQTTAKTKLKLLKTALNKYGRDPEVGISGACKSLGMSPLVEDYITRCFDQYQNTKTRKRLIDFDDLLRLGVELFKAVEISKNYDFVMAKFIGPLLRN